MRLRTLVVSAALAAAVPVLPAAAQEPSETVIAPFRGGAEAAASSRPYAGEWWVFVKGGGMAAGTQLSDAFFVYTTSGGSILPPPGVIGINEPHPWHSTLPANWVLRINGRSADELLIPGAVPTIPGSSVPEYNEAHLYAFPIAAPGGALTIGVSDFTLGDNLGAYEVTIGTRVQVLTMYVDTVTRLMATGYIWGQVGLTANDLHAALQRAGRQMATGAEAEARAELEAVLLRLDAGQGTTIDREFAALARAAITYLLRLF
jgi:hypothetical protein